MKDASLHLLGFASGIAGVDPNVAKGPQVMRESPYLSECEASFPLTWDGMMTSQPMHSLEESVRQVCEALAKKVSASVKAQHLLTVLGGDHTCAVGTWSGVYDAFYQQGDIGLIWIDAHMDSHTPDTSETGRLHGMPLAALLGYGDPAMTAILHAEPKIKPANLCLIGVRSFESGEAKLLERLNVRVYMMDEVKTRGIADVLKEAAAIVSRHTEAFGISLDLDGIDPKEAPGVDVPEPDGIPSAPLREALADVVMDPKLVAVEIVEFDPSRDRDHLTEKLVASFLKTIGRRLKT